ncbi:MAG: ClpX C4-type zinc finger protein [Acidimicrobiales bacterium]
MTNFGAGSDVTRCSFCAKGAEQVRKIIAGPDVFICDEYVGLCNDILTIEFADLSEGDRG